MILKLLCNFKFMQGRSLELKLEGFIMDTKMG